MINISIDPPDLFIFNNTGTDYKEGIAINEAESIFELISEEIFDKDVPEGGENDPDKYLEILDLYCLSSITNQIIFPEFPLLYHQYYRDAFLTHYSEPNSPPPKQV